MAELTRQQDNAAHAMALNYGRSSALPLPDGDILLAGLDQDGRILESIVVRPDGTARLANVTVDAVYAVSRGIDHTTELLHDVHDDWSGADDHDG